MEWLGIFWALVEMLYENGGELSADDESLENLAYEWRCEVEKIKIVIFECWLFVVENWKFFSNSVNERLKKITEIREKKSEAWKKWMWKRWWKNNTSYNTDITPVIENTTDVIENDNTDITESEKPITENNKEKKKEINKEIKKETEKEVSETLPVFSFDFFIKNFPKQTKIFEAQNAFLSLSNDERHNLAKVFPFWLNYWKTINPCYVPNPFDFLKNRRFLEKIPEKNGNFVAEKPQKIKPIPDNFPKDFDEKNRQKETEEREKILKFFTQLPEEIQAEITAKLEQKFANTPVKKGDHLWKISLAEMVKSTQKTDIF